VPHDHRIRSLSMTLAADLARALDPPGIHPKVVQERLGHSSITMTLDLYSHAIPAMQAEAADRIAALIEAAV
jgi:integrase